jgi:hypothetical protein
LLLFLEKEETTRDLELGIYMEIWGASPPDPPGSASPSSGWSKVFCGAELRVLLLFLEKEETTRDLELGIYMEIPPWVGFAEHWVE